MDRFLFAENPMLVSKDHPIYILHTQVPQMLIQVHHEAAAFGDEKMFLIGNYENTDGNIETITLNIAALLICDTKLTEELKTKVDKVLNKAWYWYVAFLKWEDELFDDDEFEV